MTVHKVLCVDDATSDLTMIQKVISSANLNVVSATSGKDAIRRAKTEKPDLIFLDILMPDMDGFAVMRELRKYPETKDIPVVFVSSKSQKSDQMWAKMLGGKGFLSKPVSPDVVLDEIKKF